jgi:hypothetical protein
VLGCGFWSGEGGGQRAEGSIPKTEFSCGALEFVGRLYLPWHLPSIYLGMQYRERENTSKDPITTETLRSNLQIPFLNTWVFAHSFRFLVTETCVAPRPSVVFIDIFENLVTAPVASSQLTHR